MLKSDSCSCCPFFFAIPVFSKQNSKKESSEMTKIATNLMKAGKFEKSLIKSRIALKFAIAIKDDNGIATCYNTIAATFDEVNPTKPSSTIKRTGMQTEPLTTN
jgi:hypothetical protein